MRSRLLAVVRREEEQRRNAEGHAQLVADCQRKVPTNRIIHHANHVSTSHECK